MLTLAYTFPTWLIGILIALFFVASILMILTVLIQRPMGGGLSGAFGSGAGSGQTAFGAKTGDALTIATIIMFIVFLLGAIVLNYALSSDTPPPPPTIGPAESSGASPSSPSESPPAPQGETPPSPRDDEPAPDAPSGTPGEG